MASQPEVSLQLLLTTAHSSSPALIEQLKTNSPGLKVIFLIDELEELPQERVNFLLKPFSPYSLMQKIQAVLEAASASSFLGSVVKDQILVRLTSRSSSRRMRDNTGFSYLL